MTDKYLHQSCPVYKYIYETCERKVRLERKSFAALTSSRTPTPRQDTMKDLIENNYASSHTQSSVASEH